MLLNLNVNFQTRIYEDQRSDSTTTNSHRSCLLHAECDLFGRFGKRIINHFLCVFNFGLFLDTV